MFLSKRNGIYYLWYTDQNKKLRKVSTRTRRKRDALMFLQVFRTSQLPVIKEVPTLSEFYSSLQRYITATHQPSTVDLYKRAWDQLLAIAGDVKLSALTAFHFDQYKSRRLEKVSPTRVNIELRTVKAALGVAVRWGLIESNPFSRRELARVPCKAPTVFTIGEFQRLLIGIQDKRFRNLILVATLTGLRRGEVLNLRWSHVDLGLGVLRIESTPNFRTKDGKFRSVPMNKVLLSILTEMHDRHPGEYVFEEGGLPIRGYIVSVRLKRLLRRLKLPEGLHFHSLRHSFASWLAMDGVSIYQISRLLGHSNVGTTQQFYAHLQVEQLKDTVNRITISLPKG